MLQVVLEGPRTELQIAKNGDQLRVRMAVKSPRSVMDPTVCLQQRSHSKSVNANSKFDWGTRMIAFLKLDLMVTLETLRAHLCVQSFSDTKSMRNLMTKKRLIFSEDLD
jgi:hypothetical protein